MHLVLSFLLLIFIWASLVAQGLKASACNAGNLGSIPGSGRSPGEGNSNPLQYSCLENPMDRGAWRATVHGVTKSWTWLMQLSMHVWTVTWKALLSSTIFQNLLKFMSTETVVLSKHLILCQPLLLLPSISQHQGLFQWVSSSCQWMKWKLFSCVWLFVTPWTIVHGIL